MSASVECGAQGIPGLQVRISRFQAFIRETASGFTVNTDVVRQRKAACPAGEILSSEPGVVAKCVACGSNEVSNGGAARLCYDCVRGSRPDPDDASVCSCRAVKGKGFSEKGGGSCIKCAAGSFSAVGNEKCRMCAKGSFAAERGMDVCEMCEGAERGATECS